MHYEREVKVILHGSLRKFHGGSITLSGHSASEIVNGLYQLTPELKHLSGEDRPTLSVMGFKTRESFFEPLPVDLEELHIVPKMAGGKGGFFKILVGAALIAVAFYNPTLMVGGFQLGGTTGILFNMGLSLVLGGFLEMLSPQPKADKFGNSDADPEASKYLGANQNTVKIGTRIPLLYGEHLAFGHYLSFDVDAKDVAV